MTFVNIAVAISALAGGGGPFQDFAPSPNTGGVFVVFGRFLDVWIWERLEMEFWVILAHFGSGKKMLKFQDAFRRSILDTFLAIFYNFLAACQARK